MVGYDTSLPLESQVWSEVSVCSVFKKKKKKKNDGNTLKKHFWVSGVFEVSNISLCWHVFNINTHRNSWTLAGACIEFMFPRNRLFFIHKSKLRNKNEKPVIKNLQKFSGSLFKFSWISERFWSSNNYF